MRYKPDWEKAQQKYREFWAGENHDRPLVYVTGRRGMPDAEKLSNKTYVTQRERWLDIESHIQNARAWMEQTEYLGESYPMIWPNLGPDIFGATFGADLIFEADTSYAVPFVRNWASQPPLCFVEENSWWKAVCSMTEALVEDARGDYFVGITDIHPGSDGLVSLRGPENLCMDLYDCPEQIPHRAMELYDGFCRQVDALYAITTRNLPGSTNWMGVWHPDKWYPVCSDFSCMVSTEMYARLILPEIRAECQWLGGNAIYHLDGPGAIRHLDLLLEVPEIAGIQWVPGVGCKDLSYWLPMLKKIQQAGKRIVIDLSVQDIDIALENLKPEGVFYMIGGGFTADEAREIMRKFER